MMAKRRSKGDVQVETSTAPFNSAFSGLGALREQLPAGDAPAAETPAPDEPATAATPRGKVVVRREKKGRKGKTVTRVSGIAAADASDWARRMKRELGCGGGVEGDDIVLSGDLTDRAVAWLEAAGVARVVRGN